MIARMISIMKEKYRELSEHRLSWSGVWVDVNMYVFDIWFQKPEEASLRKWHWLENRFQEPCEQHIG